MARRRLVLITNLITLISLMFIPATLMAQPILQEEPSSIEVWSPPLFAAASSSRQVGVAVMSEGVPESVKLIVQAPEATAVVPMQQTEDGLWSASIPAELMQPPLVQYRVEARQGASTFSSPVYDLEVFASMPTLIATQTGLSRKVLVRGGWGSGKGQFGRGLSEAEILDSVPSFAVDSARDRVYVLDTLNTRIQVFDLAGQYQKFLALPSSTISDLVVDPATGELHLFDNAQDQAYTLTVELAAASLKAQATPVFAAAGPLDTLPPPPGLAPEAQALAPDDQAPTDETLVADVEGTAAIIAYGGEARTALRVELGAEVLGVSNLIVDRRGAIWAMASLHSAAEGEMPVKSVVLRVDPASQQAQTTEVEATVPVGASRRIVAEGEGAALLEGDEQELRVMLVTPVSGDGTEQQDRVYLPLIANASATQPTATGDDTGGARPAALGPVRGCVTNVGYTIRQGYTIKGSGSMRCIYLGPYAKMKLTVSLQRHRWWGWQTIDQESRGYARPPQNWALGVQRSCRGSGTYTYKTTSVGTVWNDLPPAYRDSYYTIVLTSNRLRTRC
jgi:hypothetical protein